MADITSTLSVWRGLIVPGAYWHPDYLWVAESSYTEADPLPPAPETDADTDLSLECSGTVWDSQSLVIQGHRAGFPGPDQGAWVWRMEGDADTQFRGWDAPNLLTQWEHIAWVEPADATTYRDPDAVTLADGSVVVVCEQDSVIMGTPTYRVVCRVRDPSTGAWSGNQTVYSSTTAPTYGYFPCVVLLPSGRLLAFLWVQDSTGDTAQIQCSYSDDSGDTWSTWQAYCLEDEIDISGTVELRRLRAAYLDGQILMVAGLWDATLSNDYIFRQLASSDLGATLRTICTGDGDALEAYPDVTVSGGSFLLSWLSSSDTVKCVALESAYRDCSTVTGVNVEFTGLNCYSATGSGDGDLALTTDEDGTVYVLTRDIASGACFIQASTDSGDTWGFMGDSPRGSGQGIWWDAATATTYPRYISCTPQAGRLLIPHNWAADPGNEDDSLGCIYLGGYSTVTFPGLDAFARVTRRSGWTRTWIPIDLPGDAGWSASGAGTDALTSGACNVVTSASSRLYQQNPTGTIAEGIILRARVQHVSGGSLAARNVAVRLRTADGVDDYDVSVRFTGTHYRLYDENAAAAVGADQALDSATGSGEILVALAGGGVSVWHREGGTSPDRQWVKGPSSAGLTSDTGSPDANNLISFGNGLASTAESNWYELHFCSDEYTGLQIAQGVTNPDDLFPRCYSTSPVEVYGGCKLAAKDGPGGRGDSWDLPARAEHALAHIFPARAPSPRVGWRSEDTSQATIAVAADPVLLGTAESLEENDVVALFISGANWRTGSLQGYDTDTSAWVSVATIDLARGLETLAYTRSGNRISPAAGSTDQPYLYASEPVGWTVDLGSGKYRKVSHALGGKWDTTGRRAVLVLGDMDGTEPASGNASLWASSAVVIKVLSGATYAGYRIVIDAQSTADGYFTVGTAIIGPCAVFGNQYGWGRVIETTERVDLTEALDGSTRSRVLGPPSRVVEMGWQDDGVDTTQASGSEPTPNFFTGKTGGTRGIASKGETPAMLEGLLRRLDGAHVPVVYLPSVSISNATAITLNRWDQFVYARLEGPVRREVVQGEEGSTEWVRVGTVTLREVV